MKKIIILLISILLLSGCYDYVEINDLVIITGMLIDYENDNYVITNQLIENEKESIVKIYKTEGKTIDECISKLSKLLNKDIFISHLKSLIITENLIYSNKDYYDYFLRNPKSKMNFNIYFVDNKYKDKVINIYNDDKGSSLYLKDMISFNNKIFSSSTPLTFLDLIYKRLEYGLEPIYPNITVNNNILYLQNLIIFKNNKKITLDDINGIYYNLITNNLIKTDINIPCDKDNFSISTNNTKTKFKWKDNKLYVDIKVTGKMNSYNCKYDLNKTDTMTILSNLSNKELTNNINEIIKIAKDNNVDFIGITNYIYKHSKKKLNIKDIDIKTTVKTTITSIGELRK